MNDNSNFLNVEIERGDFAVLLEQCRKKKEFTDVQLQVGGKLFDAHRNVLSLYSPVLKAMISDQWSTTKACLISEEYVDVEIMEDLLSFLYTGKIQLTLDNVHPVCVAAHYLQIPSLLETSARYLCQFVTVENVLTLFEFSTTCELDCLNNSCLRFVSNNHETIFQTTQILELSANNFKNFVAGLKGFWPKMLREDTFHCIVRWIEKNLSERLNELPVLLTGLPLEELPFEFLTKTVSSHRLVKESISGIQTVSAALANYQIYSGSVSHTNLIVISGVDKTDNSPFRVYPKHLQSISCYDSRTGLWKNLPPMPYYRKYFSVTVVNQKDIIVSGGIADIHYSGEKTASLDMFDWATQTWTELPEMPNSLTHHSMAICRGKLYVAGGQPGRKRVPSSSVLCYSFETERWKRVKSMNQKRQNGQLIEYKDRLYAIGGHTPTVERYDPAQDSWTRMASMQNTSEVIATLHKDKIYVHGCEGLTGKFEEYDPETNVWKSLPAPVVGNGSSLVSLNGKLLAVGGYLNLDRRVSNLTITDSIYEFDFLTEKWIEFGKMDLGRAYHFALVGTFPNNSASV